LRCERGFTLIELLIVIALLALAVGIVIPPLGRLIPRGALGAAAAEIRATLRGAGSTAIAEGRTVIFRGDPGGGYWVGERFRPLPTVRVAGLVAFYPWGGSSGGRVWIDGPEGRRELAVDALTGHAAVTR
jgi:general secretion pathway protein H